MSGGLDHYDLVTSSEGVHRPSMNGRKYGRRFKKDTTKQPNTPTTVPSTSTPAGNNRDNPAVIGFDRVGTTAKPTSSVSRGSSSRSKGRQGDGSTAHAISAAQSSVLDDFATQSSATTTAYDDVLRTYAVSAIDPDNKMLPNHTPSEYTRAPHEHDTHLCTHLALRNVRYAPKIVDSLTDIAMQALKSASKIPPVQDTTLMADVFEVATNAAEDFRDEFGVANLYAEVFGHRCAEIAGTLHLRLDGWKDSPLRWSRGESQASNEAIADGFLRVDSAKARILNNPATTQVREWFQELAVWEFKNVIAGRYAVLKAIMELCGSPDSNVEFPWQGCAADDDACRCLHGVDEFTGSRRITGARMGYDVDSKCNLATAHWKSSPEADDEALAWADKQGKRGLYDSKLDRPDHLREHAIWIVQQAWAEAVKHDCTFLVIHTGRHEIIGMRHRETRTLYLSNIIRPWKLEGYVQLQTGLYIAIFDDAKQRASMLELQPQLKSEPGVHVADLEQFGKRHRSLEFWNIGFSNTASSKHIADDDYKPLQARKVYVSSNSKFQKITQQKTREGKRKSRDRQKTLWHVAGSCRALKFKKKTRRAQIYRMVNHIPVGPFRRRILIPDSSGKTDHLCLDARSCIAKNVLRANLFVGPDKNPVSVIAKIAAGDITPLRQEESMYKTLHEKGVPCIPKFLGLFVLGLDGSHPYAVLVLEDVGVKIGDYKPRKRSRGDQYVTKLEYLKDFERALKELHSVGYVHGSLTNDKLLMKDHGDKGIKHTIVGLGKAQPASILDRLVEAQDLRHIILGPDLKRGEYLYPCFIESYGIKPETTDQDLYAEILRKMGNNLQPKKFHVERDSQDPQIRCLVVYFTSHEECKELKYRLKSEQYARMADRMDIQFRCQAYDTNNGI